MKKIFWMVSAASVALVVFAACGAKKSADAVETVGSSDMAYVLVDQVLAESDIYRQEGVALEEKTQKTQKSWSQKEQGLQYEMTQLQEKYAQGLITTKDAEAKQSSIERRAKSYQTSMQKEAAALEEENFVFGNRAQELIRSAVKNVNSDGRYRFIINGSALIDADSTLNITAAVLAETNRLYAIEKKEAK